MNPREIFLAALEMAEPAKRAAYLEEVCGGNLALRQHLEGLLALEGHHEKIFGYYVSPDEPPSVT